MADDETKVPYSATQNPSPTPPSGQQYLIRRAELIDEILVTFRAVLPSNYVASTNGPWYSLQFQAMADQLAEIQLKTTQVFQDSNWDFTRPEFLWQVLGALVFPDADMEEGIPEIDGDTLYRSFLLKMVNLLLQGATKMAMVGGIEALDPNVTAYIIEKVMGSPPRDPEGLWTIDNQFEVEVFIAAHNQFPTDPFVLERNVQIVLAALKPAHVIYSYSHLFRDAFDTIASDDGGMSWGLDSYYYDDTRKWCLGAKTIVGTGDTLTSRTSFRDPSVSFSSVRLGAKLAIEGGANEGVYRIQEVITFPYGKDTTPRTYTTVPTGLSGTLTVTSSDTLQDLAQNWGLATDGELVTIAAGPNAGEYRLNTLLGSTGGSVGVSSGPATSVRCSPSILKVARRMPAVATGQAYTVEVDRLGVRVPHTITDEDASEQFYL
jgi:hypothetical protein